MSASDFMFGTPGQSATDRRFGTYDAAGNFVDTASNEYEKNINTIIDEARAGRLDTEEAKRLIGQLQNQEFGASSFDIGEFEDLLNRLEGSKMRQQRQRSVEGRRDIMQQGLAGMMGNF
tara:strand:+ start:5841 stop:6197 length:357 start_codon:yes stop_codon:yes gene_type:complete